MLTLNLNTVQNQTILTKIFNNSKVISFQLYISNQYLFLK